MKTDLIKQATDSLWCATGRPWRLVQTHDYRYLIDCDGIVVAEGIALGNAQFIVDCRTWLVPRMIERLTKLEALAEAIAPLVAEWRSMPKFDDDVWQKRQDVVLAFSAAMSPAQSAGTTSASQQTPASPDDSAPSVRTESEDPGSC